MYTDYNHATITSVHNRMLTLTNPNVLIKGGDTRTIDSYE